MCVHILGRGERNIIPNWVRPLLFLLQAVSASTFVLLRYREWVW